MTEEKNKKNSKFWNFIDNNINLIYFLIIIIFAIFIRYLLLKYTSGDYNIFLKPWFDELKSYGGLPALSRDIGNYTPIYMTLLALLTYLPIDSLLSIKMLSITFDIVGAFAVKNIVLELLKDKEYKDKIALLSGGVYLFLPTVFLNSAYWGQCDQIYTSFILLSILYLLRKNFKKAIIFWAIALSFKFQAILIFPLYVLMYIADRKIKLRYFLLIPIIVFAFSIPKIIFSHDLLCGFKVYLEQSGTYSQYLTLNFPNFYSIFWYGNNYDNPNLVNSPINEIGPIGIIFTLFVFATIAYFVYVKKIKFDNRAIIEFGLLSVLITTFFLPQMHERYLFMGDVLGIIYLVLNKNKFYVPIIIEILSLNGYMYLLFGGRALSLSTLGILFFVMLIVYSKDIIKKYFCF